jgi:hypothetical protein
VVATLARGGSISNIAAVQGRNASVPVPGVKRLVRPRATTGSLWSIKHRTVPDAKIGRHHQLGQDWQKVKHTFASQLAAATMPIYQEKGRGLRLLSA